MGALRDPLNRPLAGRFEGGRIDLAGPKEAAASDLRVAFSGLLANERDLRRDLPGAPPGPAGIVLALAADGGDAWVERLWGEYAIAVADDRRGTLTLIRDRVGVHPLFTAWVGGAMHFASSLDALLRAGIQARPDPVTVARFAGTHYRHVEGEGRRTAFAGIERLPAGRVLVVDQGGARERVYWAPPPEEENRFPDEGAAAEELRALLDDAVRRRLDGLDAGAVAFSLSSGMDSSTVLALARRGLATPPAVLTTVFPGWAEDEGPDVEPTARALGRWWPVEIRPFADLLEVAEGLQAGHDEPVVTVTWLWDRILQGRAAEAGARVLFGGLGGDEAFAGEFEHFFFLFADLDAAGDRRGLEREVAAWIRLHNHPRFPKSWTLVEETWRRMRGPAGRVRTDAERYSRYLAALTPEGRAAAGPPPEPENPYRSYLRNRLWQDLRSETTLPTLRAALGNAAAAGIEIRYPLLDHRIVEMVLPLPGAWKIREGVTKRVLRRAMRGVLPDAVVDRTRKAGWAAPAHEWLRGPPLDSLAALPDSPAWRTRDIYDPAALRRAIAEHRAGVADHSMFLWQVAALEAWWRRRIG